MDVASAPTLTADPRYGQNPPHEGMPQGRLPVRSYLAVPVVLRTGEVIGGLFFGHATGRKETVLVVEDDEDVRAFSAEALRELGYRVIEAGDGIAALRLIERRSIDLLFTDVVLPGGMTGAQLAAQARALRGTLKVLFTSGYARSAIFHHGRLDKGVQLITKPFNIQDLAAKLRDVLENP